MTRYTHLLKKDEQHRYPRRAEKNELGAILSEQSNTPYNTGVDTDD